ncbi:DUF6133 family protein [Pseudoflavonifractor phocaeensis]|uniref:DUF6133 family protein n=1 Tax=Pseudoflavonifractor phocaeensis TaxID=1870988 RepID=UPI00210BB21A|nr:DUF6133 family protein [Pseudoflavonifractor phocaeensis]MCQ4862669.1 DUF6133 family protein [Pseudoflavonifractor phocaeensis]
MKKVSRSVRTRISRAFFTVRTTLSARRGEAYVDTAVKVLICVVIGGLILGGLYLLFGDVVLPTLKTRIQEMFNYTG